MDANGKWVFKLDYAAFREGILKGDGIKKELNNKATQIVNAAGEGYKQKPWTGQRRAGVLVAPDTAKAYYDNLRNNTLLKSIKGV